LEALRQPLESKEVNIARVHQSVQFPAGFLLVAALNPCPCGFFGDKKRECVCLKSNIVRYLHKLSGPLLDRIDLQVQVHNVTYETIQAPQMHHTSSAQLYAGVEKATDIQKRRFGCSDIFNSGMQSHEIDKWCVLSDEAQKIVKQAFEKLNLSMRGYHKVVKIARTIADIEGVEIIAGMHMQEAVMYRSVDKFLEQQQ
ncbi:MAG TPA: ATP-binding protein, partial [Patescibacteria group bacterium]|nr:ATP-binding protein [Patescibacteria group bacterium]